MIFQCIDIRNRFLSILTAEIWIMGLCKKSWMHCLLVNSHQIFVLSGTTRFSITARFFHYNSFSFSTRNDLSNDSGQKRVAGKIAWSESTVLPLFQIFVLFIGLQHAISSDSSATVALVSRVGHVLCWSDWIAKLPNFFDIFSATKSQLAFISSLLCA